VINPLAGLQSTIQLSPSQVRGGLSEVSDQVRLKPSTTFGALSLGPTFEGIRPFAGFAIHYSAVVLGTCLSVGHMVLLS
jgi:hypothetical protein